MHHPGWLSMRQLVGHVYGLSDTASHTSAVSPQTTGHSYNLALLHRKRLLNVEVGPDGVSSVKRVQHAWYFHANMYRHLGVEQRIDNSSLHRMATAEEYLARAPFPRSLAYPTCAPGLWLVPNPKRM